jgi:outer membrane protein OmpU
MNNLKKVGLSALAGSLVAFSAQAGELSASGGAKITYTADTGNEDIAHDGNRFGLQKSVSLSGSGELDNGHTVSLSQVIATTGTLTSTVLTYDMGDMGVLKYQEDSGDLGIGIIDDMMPTADEEVSNGLDAEQTATNEGLVGKVDGGITGFNYAYTMDMATINVGYGMGADGNVDDGANSGAGSTTSSQSIAITATPMDGLTVFAGTGSKGTATQDDDHDTYGLTYAFGPLTVGYQHSEIDFEATSSNDNETDSFGISFAVNDNLSISYGEQDTEADGQANDQEVEGISVGHSMGGISIKAHSNEGKNIANTADNVSEHTEIAVSFAF